jgi:hypothetical protein
MHIDRAMARTGLPHGGRFIRFGILSLTLTAVLAACSASPGASVGVVTLASASPGASAAPSAGANDPEQAMLAYASCMRDHGIDMPDPVFQKSVNGEGNTGFVTQGAGGQTGTRPDKQPGFKAADEACKHFMANITRGTGGGQPMSAAQQEAFLKFAACMRDNGVDMADPTFEDGGVSIQIGGPDDDGGGQKIDPQSPAFQAAQQTCQHILSDAGVKGPGSGPDSAPQSSAAPGASTAP